MLTRILSVALLIGASALHAQAPRITAAGDPSVKADTIYKLAVDPSKFPEQDAAYLLDDGVIRWEADGRGTKTFRQIVQVLKPSAVERLQEQSVSWSPGHERMRVNWVRVVRPDGRVISAKPSHVQESDVPADTDDPVYTDRRVRRMSLSGVAPGTLVDYSYTTEEIKPFMPGHFYQWWGVSTGLQVARSRLVVDVPESLTPRIFERNLNFKRVERTANGRRVYTWATGNLAKVKSEPLAADSNGVYMSVAVSAPLTWQEIGRWYAGLAAPRSVASPFVNARVDSVVKLARTRDDTIRAVHKWVAQDIRYVAIELGIGGYQPRRPEEVVRSGFGDCKDKATLFTVALTHLGIPAYPVLLNSGGGVRRELPALDQLDHEIAAVALPGGGYQFVDLTASLIPYGELPWGVQGEFGLVVRPDGTSEVATLPQLPVTANRMLSRTEVTLDTLGRVSGTYTEMSAGGSQGGLRRLFSNPLDSAQRTNLANNLAGKLFEGAHGDSLWGFEGKDLAAPAKMGILIRDGSAATRTGNTMILQMPLSSMGPLAVAAREIEAEGPRKFPIDPAKFWGPRVSETEYVFHLPPGWRADLPKSVTANSPFGSYQSEYTLNGSTLRLVRRITGSTAVQPPEKVGDLIAWLRTIGSDDAKVVVLTRL